jgi:transketolase
MTSRASSCHVGGGLSMAEILAVLYGDVLKVRPEEPNWAQRDRLILSKGHACAGLYAALAERGFLPVSELEKFYLDGSRLVGHATHQGIPGVECSTGSLGHGLGIACGMALAGRDAAAPFRAFAILSDGECDEGSTWEAALFAGHHRLDNLTVIVDYNEIQSLGSTHEVLELEPFPEKWRAFGWHTEEVNGHDVSALQALLHGVPVQPGRPTCLIAHTVKGKGVSFMENQLLWHYRTPQGDELARALAEIAGAKE